MGFDTTGTINHKRDEITCERKKSAKQEKYMMSNDTQATSMTTDEREQWLTALLAGTYLGAVMYNGTSSYVMGAFGLMTVVAFTYIDKKINPELWTTPTNY